MNAKLCVPFDNITNKCHVSLLLHEQTVRKGIDKQIPA